MVALANILLGLTASERWAAARRMSPRSVPEQWFVLLGVAVMLVLLVALLAISIRRRQQSQRQRAEQFDLEALRRGLTVRERQILTAIAARSGRRPTSAIFHAADAFHRGAVQLLGEFAQTRTPPENTELKGEVLRLREKLGFPPVGRGQTGRDRPSSRDIPVGQSIELTGGKGQASITVEVRVLRNDELELVVALRTPMPSEPGDPWLACYCSGTTAWEFRTSTVRCDGKKLTLHHSDEIRSTNRRRFPRVPVRARALLAQLPLLQSELAAPEENRLGVEGHEAGGPRPVAEEGPVFVESTVTEFAGPGLRIETRLNVRVDDRVLVVVHWAQGRDGAPVTRQTLAAIGRVKRGQSVEGPAGIPDAIDRVWETAPQRRTGDLATQPLLIAVELVGLTDEEIDALVSLTDELSSATSDNSIRGATEPQETPASAKVP